MYPNLIFLAKSFVYVAKSSETVAIYILHTRFSSTKTQIILRYSHNTVYKVKKYLKGRNNFSIDLFPD